MDCSNNGSSYLLDTHLDPDQKSLVLIRPPGNGKSWTYIITGCISFGVILVMQPTQTLAADQAAKLKALPKSLRIRVLELDLRKNSSSWTLVVDQLKLLV